MTIESELSRLIADLPDGISEGVALGTGLAEGYDLYQSPIGTVAVTFNLRGVSSVDMADSGFADRFARRFGRSLFRAEAPAAWRRHIPSAIEAGTPGKVPIDLRVVTAFQQEVLTVTATIPKGEVRPYAWLANEVDRPRAVRAAGSAVARNPIPLIIPCHRVVRSDGHIGAYSLGGPENKHDLLAHEGARPEWLEELATRRVRVRGDVATGIYCHPSCSHHTTDPALMIDFRSIADAEGQGFRPCQDCRPC